MQKPILIPIQRTCNEYNYVNFVSIHYSLESCMRLPTNLRIHYILMRIPQLKTFAKNKLFEKQCFWGLVSFFCLHKWIFFYYYFKTCLLLLSSQSKLFRKPFFPLFKSFASQSHSMFSICPSSIWISIRQWFWILNVKPE